MHTYLIKVTGQSKAAWEKHYTTTTWTAYNGTDRDAARKVAKEVAHGTRVIRVIQDGTECVAIWNSVNGWQKLQGYCTCADGNLCSRHADEYQATYGRAWNE